MNNPDFYFMRTQKQERGLDITPEPPHDRCPIKCKSCEDRTDYLECPKFQTSEEQSDAFGYYVCASRIGRAIIPKPNRILLIDEDKICRDGACR